MQMATSMMENGRKIKLMVLEPLLILTMQCMKVNGVKINNMVMVKRLGVNKVARQQPILDNFTKARKTVKADFSGRTAHTMKVILLMDTLWAMEDTTLQIWINTTRESLEAAIWKEEELKHGQMGEDMKEILKMVKKTVKVHLSGLLELNILEVGEMENNTVLESFIILKKDPKSKVNGRMVKELGGSKEQKCLAHHHLQENKEFENCYTVL